MASSPIPTLADILYYTPSDSYDYLTDNRPVHQLDVNIRSVATSLVGIGYGEHSSIDGRLYTPGKMVELVEETGKIKYPQGSYSTPPRLGLVIGSSSAGLNRVIWGSSLLDLESLGLLGSIPSNATKMQWLAVDSAVPDTAPINIILDTGAAGTNNLRFGRVESRGYISINPLLVPAQQLDPIAQQNHNSLYGFTKVRNLLMAIDIGQSPIQYTKRTIRYGDVPFSSGYSFNSMSAQLSSGVINFAGSTVTTIAGASTLPVKEVYSRYVDSVTQSDVVQSKLGTQSAWVSNSYNTDIFNFELQPLTPTGPGSIDYSASHANLEIFKNFKIEKYYQYHKTSNTSDPLFSKVLATATVFRSPDPLIEPGYGGEPVTIIIWDFYEYAGFGATESTKTRVITTGSSAEDIFLDSAIFPVSLRAL